MKTTSSFPGLVFIILLSLGALTAYKLNAERSGFAAIAVFIFSVLVAGLVAASIRVADQWTRGIVLRLGKFRSLEGPGLFFIIPLIETIPYWIDTRVLTSSFKAEKTLTKDTVPVDVDAVLFWKIVDPKMAALNVADYQAAINWASQTALRDVIGKTNALRDARRPRQDQRLTATDHRLPNRALGHQRHLGGGEGRPHSFRAGRCNVYAGAG